MNSEMREVGQVVKQKGNLVTVRFPRKSTCEHCNMCAIKPNDSHVDMTLENTLNCNIDDRVEVNISRGTVFKMSMLVYFFPMVVGILGLVIAYLLEASEVIQMVACIGGIALAFLVLAIVDRFYAVSKKGKPYLVRILDEDEVVEE
ncbi:MAG: SoxR reducing system RseC family protein [Clostridia bacterium]|nr:SoxR reducing system RseC family protein [Clostridia bacterium]